ncbi:MULTISPECIES: metal-dependent transcriptional regulator [Sphingobacterium]|jgi:DtxR family Mn-dependent transcriptional regulator|uniref:Transcriptional regulator MntR n=2 Tax=Sphingobacterium TaxID=28453 RepID=A0ABX7CK77_SPHMU|nr:MULTISPECIES: metal-dependent transcriptional regulator [Sphingobacterium]HAK28044.1 metal-dependent transcriptional regulator [Sphingobacterium sp.]APU96005.1 iron (metal) dependent repressor, dtxr family protein [Sphingobacterium sp. B29]QQT31592.1 metal-dependent transcriptional regulator [Sphingobacterium multivorum]QQT52467.1 metal-dependent transcriptional regulator [Sphingobacterium multivorum]TWI19585.1 DtxR family iron (metal) dependent repressor [Sphingobacterium siyangense]
MISQTEENYLKALYNLTYLKGDANVNEISKRLDIKMPTVNSMMKKLADKGFVHYESYKPLRLTEEGKKEAALIIRKHRLTEMYLVEKMGFAWDEVHQIAEQIEHIHSPEFFSKMDELLGYPTVDPHGSPIPDSNGVMPLENYVFLNSCKVGDIVTLMAVQPSSKELLQYLTAKNLELGTTLTIKSIEPFDASITVEYKDRPIEVLSSKVTATLLVRLIA